MRTPKTLKAYAKQIDELDYYDLPSNLGDIEGVLKAVARDSFREMFDDDWTEAEKRTGAKEAAKSRIYSLEDLFSTSGAKLWLKENKA